MKKQLANTYDEYEIHLMHELIDSARENIGECNPIVDYKNNLEGTINCLTCSKRHALYFLDQLQDVIENGRQVE